MAVQLSRQFEATPFASGSIDPSGAVTVGSGTNRTLIYVQQAYLLTQSATASVAIGGQAATGLQIEKWSYISTSAHLMCWVWYWDEAAVAAISAGGSSNVTYSDNSPNFNSRISNYATYSSTDQTTPVSFTRSEDVATSATNPIVIAYGGSAGDYVVGLHQAFGGGASAVWDGTLSQLYSQTVSDLNGGIGYAAWSSTQSTWYAQAAGGIDILGVAAKINQLVTVSASVTGSGSVDGIIATIAGVGERTITGTGSADAPVAGVDGGLQLVDAVFSPYTRIVHIDDVDPAYQVTLHERPTYVAEHVFSFARAGTTFDDDHHIGVDVNDAPIRKGGRIFQQIERSVTVQGLN